MSWRSRRCFLHCLFSLLFRQSGLASHNIILSLSDFSLELDKLQSSQAPMHVITRLSTVLSADDHESRLGNGSGRVIATGAGRLSSIPAL